MNMEVLWTERARIRLKGILEYISKDNPIRAKSFVLELIESAENIAEHPYMGRVVPEYERSDIREIVHGDYRVIYMLRNSRVEILTVRHCSQLLPNQK